MPRMDWVHGNRLRVILWLTFLSTAISIVSAREAPKISNFGETNSNYFRGGQPKAAEFAELKCAGIKTVIELQLKGEAKEPIRARCRAAVFQYTAFQPAASEH
jgi:hypothetical protein